MSVQFFYYNCCRLVFCEVNKVHGTVLSIYPPQDKNLRKFLKDHIVTDIKNINTRCKDVKLNKELQNFMYQMLVSRHAVAAKYSLDVLIQLYQKRVWNDAKTVNIISTACFSKITKIMVTALRFFIGKDEDDEDKDSDSDSEEEDTMGELKAVIMANRFNKKTRTRKKKLDKAKNLATKGKKKKNAKASFDFSALHLVHDPQNLAERMYRRLVKMNEKFEVKLMTMNFISRLIGVHQLYLPNFYPLVQRYLFPHQPEVTKVMVFAAQAAHDQVPPDDLEPLLKTLANNFVTERYSSEVIAMGLNAIRELCVRNPYCMSEELLQDLAQFKTYKDKGVMMAARSLITVFREKNPDLLRKKDRGAPTEISIEKKQDKFGANYAKSYIPGAEILAFKTDEKEFIKNDSDTDSDGDDGWINVPKGNYDVSFDFDDSDDDDDQSQTGEGEDGDDKVYTAKQAMQEVMKLSAEERAAKAEDIMSSRFLTDADFARIAAVQAAKQVEKFSQSKKNKRGKKRKMEDDVTTEPQELVPLKNIEMIYKKRKRDYEARMETVLAGREGRGSYGARKGKVNPHASTTNKQKVKTKNFMMMKHKNAGKQKMSFREKQLRLKKALLRQKKFR